MWADMVTIAKGLGDPPMSGRWAGISVRLDERNDLGMLELGISAVVGHPRALAVGEADTCGQCIEDIAAIPASKLVDGWDAAKLRRLIDIWKRWHLNGMTAGCEHQTALKFHMGEEFAVGEECPVCHYKYGHEWRREELPADVLAFVRPLAEERQTASC